MAMLLTLIVLLIVIVAFMIPKLIRLLQLHKDYRNISFLPISPILFIGNMHVIDMRPHAFFQLMCRMSKECQDQGKGIFCFWYTVWPNLFLCSAKGLETFINNSKQLVKSFEYTHFEPWLKTGLLTSNGEKWRSRRRLITPSFHDNQLLHNFMYIFNEQASILAHRFEECTKKDNQIHELYPYISACTLDIIAEAATGTNVNAQLGGEKNEFVQATVRVTETAFLRLRSPWLWRDFIFNRLPIGREHAKALKVLHGFSRKIIEERLATFNVEEVTNTDDRRSRRRLAFLDSLLTQMRNEKLTLDDIQEEVDTFMFAGHDTTATAITFFCYLMGCYPDIQAKVQAEIDSIFGDDEERECTMEDIQKMTYLDCVIKESMRVCPPVPVIAREVQEDCYYHDQILRKGTTVAIFIYAIHHDANVFPNPDKFDPDRFADSSLTSDERSSFAFIPFSAGSRNCIGQRFAGLEIRVILSTLFRRFSFQSTQTLEDLQLSVPLILRTEVPVKLIIKPRQ